MDPTSRSDLVWPALPATRIAAARPQRVAETPEPAVVTGPDGTETSVASGDATGVLGAFERLFMREYARVVTAAYRVLGDRQAAEDAAQEAFVAFQHRYPADAPFAAAWLHAAAVHGALNQLRSDRRRRQRESAPTVGTPTADTGSRPEATDPLQLVEAEETRRDVRRALARMAPRNAAVLVLRYSGLSYAEVAAALGVPVNQVGTLLRRAEAMLRKELQDAPPR